jgi:3'-phosphoadenosine 5'-phosphosulfate sulfotransferase (PAPS reductase)/FAD synthetase
MLNNDNDMRRRMSELCARKRSFVLNPIVDWTELEVWKFIVPGRSLQSSL